MTAEPEELATQDLLLIAESLVWWAGPPTESHGHPRKRRAWTLVDEIAAELGLYPDELMKQIDSDWSGPD